MSTIQQVIVDQEDHISLGDTLKRIVSSFFEWINDRGLWYLVSGLVHMSALVFLSLIIIVTPGSEGDAPEFEAEVETAIPEPNLTHFEVGDPPLDPTVLDTASLLDFQAVQMEQTELKYDDNSQFVEAAGGAVAANNAPAVGGLGGFSIQSVGAGPVLKGAGGVGGGTGTGGGNFIGQGEGQGFASRGQGMRQAAVGAGGTKASERAVAAALNWIARHQNPNGSWSLHGYQHRCKDPSCAGMAGSTSDPAATAFALLPFFGAGQTHMSKGPYQKTIYGGIQWLMLNQKNTGNYAPGTSSAEMYSHGLCTIAMCEAYGLTYDSRLRESAQAAVDFIVSGQDPQTGGWWYTHRQPGGDTSVFGWQLMALKSAQMAGLEVPANAFQGSRVWLKSVAKGNYGGRFSYRPDAGPSETMSAVGLLCSQYLGTRRDDPAMTEGVSAIMKNLPKEQARNCYFVYYATQVMHNIPGAEWDTWNRQMRRTLIETQVKNACAAGSWDPDKPTVDTWGERGGRVMVTSLSALSLEVYYRYLPLYKLDKQNAEKDLEAKLPN